MIETQTTSIEQSDSLWAQLERIIEAGLARTSFRIMVDARNSIEITRRPSLPGQPPHSRRGALREAIAFGMDLSARAAFIGPRYSKINLVGRTQEFGGMFRNRTYPPRPFMRPALDRNLHFFAASFGGTSA